MKITVYGSRGSFAYSRRENVKYGGNTMCVRIDCASGRTLIFDCGSGLNSFSKNELENAPSQIDVFIGHLHFDHIAGLPAFAPLYSDGENGKRVKFYSVKRGGGTLAEQIFGAFKPPYWPFPLAERVQSNRNISFQEIFAGGIVRLSQTERVTAYKAAHSDYTVFFVLEEEYDGKIKKVVYMTDYELPFSDNYSNLSQICQNADLLLFDSTYLPQDYHGKEGFGHSTLNDGARLATDSNAKYLLLCHLSHSYSDTELDNALPLLRAHEENNPSLRIQFARDGMTISL